jgi:hypothetical protein
MKVYHFLLLAAASLVLGLGVAQLLTLAASYVRETTPEAVAQPEGTWTVYELERFRGFPVYWLGESYQGLPLTDIAYVRDAGPPDGSRPPVEYVALVYGTCEIPAGAPEETAGCAPPIQVITDPFCLNRPSWLAQAARVGSPETLRGALAQHTQSGNLHVYTADATIVVFASAGPEAAEQAVMALRGANALGAARAAEAGTAFAPPMREENCGPPTLSPLAGAEAEEGP